MPETRDGALAFAAADDKRLLGAAERAPDHVLLLRVALEHLQRLARVHAHQLDFVLVDADQHPQRVARHVDAGHPAVADGVVADLLPRHDVEDDDARLEQGDEPRPVQRYCNVVHSEVVLGPDVQLVQRLGVEQDERRVDILRRNDKRVIARVPRSRSDGIGEVRELVYPCAVLGKKPSASRTFARDRRSTCPGIPHNGSIVRLLSARDELLAVRTPRHVADASLVLEELVQFPELGHTVHDDLAVLRGRRQHVTVRRECQEPDFIAVVF